MASRFKFWLAVILAIGFLFFCDAYLGEYSLGIVNNIAIFVVIINNIFILCLIYFVFLLCEL